MAVLPRRWRRRWGLSQSRIRWLARSLALILILPFAVGGANAALLSGVASLLYLGWAALAFVLLPSDTGLARRMAPVAIPLLLLLGWVALPVLRLQFGAAMAPALLAPDLFGIAWCHACSLVAVVLSTGCAGRLRGFARITAHWLCVFGALLMAGTLAMRAFGSAELIAGMIEDQRQHRFSGLIGNANAAGISFGMISILMGGIALERWGDVRTVVRAAVPLAASLALIGAVVAFVLVALSQSRTAFAATGIALIVLIAGSWPGTARRGASRTRGALALGLLVAGAATGLAATAVLDRYTIAGADGSSRIAILRHYAQMALDAPLIGHGLGSFVTLNQRQLTPETVLQTGDFGAAHNALVQLAIEAGWPAVGLVGIALGAIVWRMLRDRRVAGRTRGRVIGRALLLAVAIAATGSMVDIALNVPAIAGLSAALLGLAWGRSLGGDHDPAHQYQRFGETLPPWPTPPIRN